MVFNKHVHSAQVFHLSERPNGPDLLVLRTGETHGDSAIARLLAILYMFHGSLNMPVDSTASLPKDEISISLGVEPRMAVELAEALQKGPALNNFNAQQLALPPAPKTTDAAVAEKAVTPDPVDPPKKKPKAPRPEARYSKHVCVHICHGYLYIPVLWQGSDMEVCIMVDTDLSTFLNNWKNACTAAEGKATMLKSSPMVLIRNMSCGEKYLLPFLALQDPIQAHRQSQLQELSSCVTCQCMILLVQ